MSELIHFTSTETLIKHILPKMELRASNLINLNDPLENKWSTQRWLGYTSKDGRFPSEEYENYYSENLPKLGQFIKVLCFCDTEHYLVDKINFQHPTLNLRMWSQYGANHTGSCIVFNKDKLVNSIKQQFGGSFLLTDHILYRNEHVDSGYGFHNIDDYDSSNLPIESFFHENIKSEIKKHPWAIISKTIDWRDELEFRVAIYDENTINSYARIHDSIEKIIFGINTDNEYIRIIQSLYPTIELHRVKINSNFRASTHRITGTE